MGGCGGGESCNGEHQQQNTGGVREDMTEGPGQWGRLDRELRLHSTPRLDRQLPPLPSAGVEPGVEPGGGWWQRQLFCSMGDSCGGMEAIICRQRACMARKAVPQPLTVTYFDFSNVLSI